MVYTAQRLQSSSFLVMTYFRLRDYNIQPKRELLWSLWVEMIHNMWVSVYDMQAPAVAIKNGLGRQKLRIGSILKGLNDPSNGFCPINHIGIIAGYMAYGPNFHGSFGQTGGVRVRVPLRLADPTAPSIIIVHI